MKKDRLELARKEEYGPKPQYKDYLPEIKMKILKNQVRRIER